MYRWPLLSMTRVEKVEGPEAVFKADRLKRRSAVLLPAAAALCAELLMSGRDG